MPILGVSRGLSHAEAMPKFYQKSTEKSKLASKRPRGVLLARSF